MSVDMRWDSSFATGSLIFTNNDLDIRCTANSLGTRGTVGKTNGKWYYEIVMGSTVKAFYLGWGNKLSTPSVNTNKIEYYISNLTISTGDVIGIGYDFSNQRLEIFQNGEYKTYVSGLVTGGATGELFPNFRSASSSTTIFSTNFDVSTIVYLPDGYYPVNYNSVGKSLFYNNGTYKYYKPETFKTPEKEINLVPTMTSDTAPSGTAMASSVYNSTFPAWKAFDNSTASTNNSWVSTTTTGWIGYKFPSPVKIDSYQIYPMYSELTRSPKAWTFEGSNDATNAGVGTWVTLDTQVEQTTWVNRNPRVFNINTTESYSAYRLNITENNGHSTVSVGELALVSIIPSSGTDTPPTWVTVSTSTPTEGQFNNFGIGDLSPSLDRREHTLVEGTIPVISNEQNYKIKKLTINNDQYKYLKKIEIKEE